MSKDMKLIMENWRHNVLYEDESSSLGDEVAEELEGIFLNAFEEMKDETENELNEAVGISLLFFIWTKVVAGAALGALLAKVGKYFAQKVAPDGETKTLDKLASFFDGATEFTATLALKGPVKWVVERYSKGDLKKQKENLAKVDQLFKLMTFLVCLAVAGNELIQGVTDAGGSIVDMVKDLGSKAGIQDVKAIQALANLIETTSDVGEASWDAMKFAKKAVSVIGKYLKGA